MLTPLRFERWKKLGLINLTEIFQHHIAIWRRSSQLYFIRKSNLFNKEKRAKYKQDVLPVQYSKPQSVTWTTKNTLLTILRTRAWNKLKIGTCISWCNEVNYLFYGLCCFPIIFLIWLFGKLDHLNLRCRSTICNDFLNSHKNIFLTKSHYRSQNQEFLGCRLKLWGKRTGESGNLTAGVLGGWTSYQNFRGSKWLYIRSKKLQI